MKRSDAVEDVVADACEMVLKDSKAAEKLAKENKSLAQTIADWLHGFYEDIKAAFEGVEARSKEAKAMTDYMDELVKLWDDALIEASKGESKQSGKVKASLRQFEDGRKFVEIDTEQEQFDGLSLVEQRKLAAKVIKRKFAGKVIGVTNRAFVNGKAASEYSRPVKDITDPVIKEAKMRASTELDNLLEAGVNFRKAPDGLDGHVHPEATGGFGYFDTLFKVGTEYYAGVVNIMFTDKGARIKDVTKIRNATKETVSSYGLNPKSNFLSDTSIISIRDTNTNVNYSRRDSSEGLTKEEARAQAQAYTRLKAENAALQRRLEYWQGQTKRTKQRTINRGDVDRYARQLIKMRGSTVDEAWLKQKLREMGDYLVQTEEPDYSCKQKIISLAINRLYW